jgi:uncharacterized protein (UPF0305 family)
MNRASIVSELARVLQVNEIEAERILKAFAQILGPAAAEVPPYFERYFEAQIQLVLQRIEDLERSTQQQISDLRQSTQQQITDLRQQITELRQYVEMRIDRLEKWLLGVLVMILSGVLAIIFRIYFGG